MTTSSVLAALASAPFGLMLSLPRIVYQAWILHYRKRLVIYIRPEPKPARTKWLGALKPAGGIKWLDQGVLERFARRKVEAFVQSRVEETGISVKFVYADPSVPDTVFEGKGTEELTIYYLAPSAFTLLFVSPSPEHALLITEKTMSPSSRDLFITLFTSTSTTATLSRGQKMRLDAIPSSLHHHDVPNVHPFESVPLLWILLTLDRVEEWVFGVVRARTVRGDEPWKKWERTVDGSVGERSGIGSVIG